MKFSIKSFFKNFSYSLISNLTSMLISSIIIAVVPKILGVDEFGYYQLYIFYAGYVGFFHIGWCDGIYLKYGGIEYDQYNKTLMSSQFWLLAFFELLISCVLYLLVYTLVIDINKIFIFYMVIINIIFVIPKTMLSYLLQISNRIKEYSFVIISEKISYFLLTIVFLFFNLNSFQMLVIADVIGKLISLIIGILYCKDIVFYKTKITKKTFIEAYDNISIGIKLLAANIAGMLILGIIRVSIEHVWDIATYGKISLALNISNMMLIFINAIGIVIFPVLKRLDFDKIKKIYSSVRDGLMIILFSALLFYIPLKIILSSWLPSYIESLQYLAILFPICLYDCKMSLLVNTYLKVLRKEKYLLLVNIFVVFLSVLLTWIVVYIMENIYLTILSILFLFALRCVICEIILNKLINLSLKEDIFIETLICIMFIMVNICFENIFAFIGYFIIYCLYLLYKRKYLSLLKNYFLNMINKN